jgi:hypothetical protein
MAPTHTLVAAIPADAVMEPSVAAIPDQWATAQSETVQTLPSTACLDRASVRECPPTEPPVLVDLDDLDLATNEA